METPIHADARVELIAVVFHLAAAPGYASALDTPYRRAVDQHFAPFAQHPVIAATQELRAKFGISHNAPVGLAVYLDPRTLEPLRSIADATQEDLDARWRDVPVGDYLAKLRDFAVAARFSEFFAGQKTYVAAVEERLSRALANQRVGQWFESTLGAATVASFVVVPGLLTGPWSYEASTHDATGEHSYEIVELEQLDQDGLPVPTALTVDIVVHEMAHAYVNPFVEKHRAELEVARPIFDKLHAAMEKQAYRSWPVMVEESLVRALTTLFILDRQGRPAAATEVTQEERRGFLWMPQLVEQLAQLRAAAGGKIDLEARLGDLTAFFATIAGKIAHVQVS
jgi:hypothetical protein